jgi:amidase
MHWPSLVRAAWQARLRNVLAASIVLLASSTTWQQPTGVVFAKSKVPFRFMEATILDTQKALESGTVTSEELVEMYLARIAAYDKTGAALNAMIYLNPNALAEAQALDAERRTQGSRGALHGIPVVLKDNYDTYDMPTAAASLSLAGSVPPDDAYLVRRLRQAGAVFIGKTNMHEFAYGITSISSLGGQTLNPYDLTRNPGGSSGGTGAAVAANFAVFGMGSDTCGSIRIPSSHNSLVGLRVTQSLFSRDGIIPLALTQDVGGPLARSVEDVAVVLDATAGFDPNDPATEISIDHTPHSYTDALRTGRLDGARFGLLTDALVTTPEDQEVANVILAAKGELEALGATVVDVAIPNYATVSNTSVIAYEFNENLDAYLAATPAAPFKTLQDIVNSGLYHPTLQTLLTNALGLNTSMQAYKDRLAGREVFKQALLDAMNANDLDGLVYPTIRQKPVPVPSTSQPGSNCRVSAQSGLPAISVPAGFTPDGIPVGMEFLGREFTESDLLGFAYSWEQATHVRRAPSETVPELLPEWTHVVTDGDARFEINSETHQLRFTAPGTDTFVYRDPDMKMSKQWIHGELTDSRWRIRYKVPVELSKSKSASVDVDSRWAGGGSYDLDGRPGSQ